MVNFKRYGRSSYWPILIKYIAIYEGTLEENNVNI